MKHAIRLKVNGDGYDLSVDPNELLIDVLRNRLDLTGTKEGCGAGDCGACTVMIDGRSVNSCLILAVEADGRDILTIEGIAKDGKLSPIQKAFIDEGAIQCGFCTPGMVLSSKPCSTRIRIPRRRRSRGQFQETSADARDIRRL